VVPETDRKEKKRIPVLQGCEKKRRIFSCGYYIGSKEGRKELSWMARLHWNDPALTNRCCSRLLVQVYYLTPGSTFPILPTTILEAYFAFR